MTTQEHISVLLNESIDLLNIKENGIYVDCTLGRAGHSVEILKKIHKGHLYAIDQDQTAVYASKNILSKYGKNFTVLQGNFSDIKLILILNKVEKVDGIIYDLGVSSPQLDNPNRGFSYRYDAPLDMRMDIDNNQLTAKEIVNTFNEQQLADIFYKYGDEKFSYNIAKNIIKQRNVKEINTTLELVEIIKQSLPQKILKQKKHPAKKVFQALRVFINNEIDALKKSLIQSLELLNSDGRLIVISFQSQEEKVIKDIFKAKTINKTEKFLLKLPSNDIQIKKDFELLIKKPIKPSEKEISQNRRAHSAKLWAIKKVV